jgi:hypothetical protein
MVSGVRVRELEVGVHGAGPLNEELDRLDRRDLIAGHPAGWRQLERWNGIFLLTREMQRHPTGDNDSERWAGVEQLSDSRRGSDDVFEVVEDQQRTGTLQVLAEQWHQLCVTPVAQTERGANRGQHLALVADRCKLDEDRAARVRVVSAVRLPAQGASSRSRRDP